MASIPAASSTSGSDSSSARSDNGFSLHEHDAGLVTHPNSLYAQGPISPGAYNPSHLNLAVGSVDGSNKGRNGSSSISSNGHGANDAASPSSSTSPTYVRPTVIQKPLPQPLPAFVYVPSNQRYLLVGFFQIFAIWLLYTFTAYQIGVPWQVFLKLRNINQNSVDSTVDTLQAFLLFLWIMPAYAILFPFSLSVTIIVKWVLIGRYKEGRHKLWSWYYFRWWFVQRIIGLVPLVYFRGTVLMNLYARLMGMKLGRDVFLNSFNFEAWDLIEIGEDSAIGCDAHVSNFHVEHGYLTISRVTIGKRSYVGTRSIVQGNMEDDTQLGAMSLLSHGKTIKSHEAWRGSPAKKVGTVDNSALRKEDETEDADDQLAADLEKSGARFRPVQAGKNSLSQSLLPNENGASDAASDADEQARKANQLRFGRPGSCRLFSIALFQFFFICGVLSAIILISASPGLLCIHYIMGLPNSDLFPSIDTTKTVWQYFAVIPCMGVSFVITFLFQVTVLKNIIMRGVEPGSYWIYSGWYVRKWMVDCLLQLSLHTVYTMYATMYLPPWLRTLGMKLGKGTEVSTAADYCPDCVEIGAGCFVADSVYLGVPTVYMGVVRMEKVKVGSRTFLGNGACLNLDVDIGSDSLLGVMSAPPSVKVPKERLKDPILWPEQKAFIGDATNFLGSPPMLLPNRQQAQGTFDAASTFNPTYWLYFQRLTFEFFRITLPFMFISALMLMYMGNFEYLLFQYNDTYLSLTFFWMVIWPCCYVGAAFVCCFIVILFKWVLVGTYVPSEAPLWSNFGQSPLFMHSDSGCDGRGKR